MRAWVNGSLFDDAHTAVLPVTDHGITVGDAVFETVKVVAGEPFALTRHLSRLAHSAKGIGLEAPDEEQVRRAVRDVLEGSPAALQKIRITYTAGDGPLGSGRGTGSPTLVVVADDLEPPATEVRVVTVPWVRNERGALAGLKTTSYAENVVALAFAAEHEASEALFANTRGNLCEGTGSNVFYVVDGELRTPSLGSGCLAGVSRALVLEWCGGREVDEPFEVLRRAEEMFLAGTTRDVQPVSAVDGRALPWPGPLTARCMEVWARRAAETSDP
ncbi:MAG TPA: aminotransferase class IV [Nocardioidaceae bacterium]|nr:aminotransferase class IV [Nocardioidaceae bacterium]